MSQTIDAYERTPYFKLSKQKAFYSIFFTTANFKKEVYKRVPREREIVT